MVAAALRRENVLDQQVPTPSRGEVLARYRHLREIGRRHNSDALQFVSRDAIRHHVHRLGLHGGGNLIVGSMDEVTLAFDLAFHTAPAGRSRAIDRYARSTRFAAGSDEALVLKAMCDARFAVVQLQRRHPAAGVIVTDLFRQAELWLVDEGVERSAPDGTGLATRYYTPEGFSMTAGVAVPVGRELVSNALASIPQIFRKPAPEAVQDRRFAEAIYRTAIADGIMEQVTFEDPADRDDAA